MGVGCKEGHGAHFALWLTVRRSEDWLGELKAFHAALNKLRKERGVRVAAVTAPDDPKFVADVFRFVLTSYLVKRRALEPKNAALLLQKRSQGHLVMSDEMVSFLAVWATESYPSVLQVSLPAQLRPVVAAPVTASGALSRNNSG